MAKWNRTVTVLHTVAAFGSEAQCSVCHFCSMETYMLSIARSWWVLYVKVANCWLSLLWGVTAVSCVVVVFCLFVCLSFNDTHSHPLWSGPGEPADTSTRGSGSIRPRVACVRRGPSEKSVGRCWHSTATHTAGNIYLFLPAYLSVIVQITLPSASLGSLTTAKCAAYWPLHRNRLLNIFQHLL